MALLAHFLNQLLFLSSHTKKMSWQNYVDQQLMGSGFVSKAVIAGHDGTLWAKSDNIDVSKICRFLLSPVTFPI